MIYLDNAATTFPKPLSVRNAAAEASLSAANPGRSGHKPSIRAAEEIYRARKTAAELFHAAEPSKVIFTVNCTTALNTVMKGVLKSGDHVVVSELEHNAVMRPLTSLKERGVSYSIAKVYPEDNDSTVDAFRKSINAKTRMIICTHASNVWGIRLPIERITALAHEYGVLITVDAAQSGGVLPVDIEDSKIDFLCLAGHKGLYGPMGTGMLIIGGNTIPESLTEGGTGSNSMELKQPEELPDRLESGTPNVAGIAGLRAGMEFVMSKTPEKIARHEYMLIQRIYRGLQSDDRAVLYFPEPKMPYYVPVLSFNLKGIDCETVAQELNRYGIAVRSGLHCSPLAHRMAGTEEVGTVRVSPSVWNKTGDADRFLAAIHGIEKQYRNTVA